MRSRVEKVEVLGWTKSTEKKAEMISDTVDLFPKNFTMPNMFSTDTSIHAAQDLIHALRNTATDSPVVTLGYDHTAALRALSVIFNKSTPRAINPKVVPNETQNKH